MRSYANTTMEHQQEALDFNWLAITYYVIFMLRERVLNSCSISVFPILCSIDSYFLSILSIQNFVKLCVIYKLNVLKLWLNMLYT